MIKTQGLEIMDIILVPVSEPLDEAEVLADRLKHLRYSANISKKKLAEEIGVNPMSIVNYESGKRTPDAKLIIKFAKFFGCTADYLLGLSEFKNQNDISKTIADFSAFGDKFNNLSISNKKRVIEVVDFTLGGIKDLEILRKYEDISEMYHLIICHVIVNLATLLCDYEKVYKELTDTDNIPKYFSDLIYTILGIDDFISEGIADYRVFIINKVKEILPQIWDKLDETQKNYGI